MAFAFRKRKCVTGTFKPLNTEKYVGSRQPFYRSSYERHFMRWADNNPNVVRWGSESITIPYLNPVDKKIHLYIVDNFVELKTKDGIYKFLIEIKPAKYTKPPVQKTKKYSKRLMFERVMYAENSSKWEAADKFAKKHNMRFLIVDEHLLGIK